jgi:glycosyltransferase involved in cell wall biosynthesis
MTSLAKEPERRAALGAAGRAKAAQFFDWSKKLGEMLEVYESAMLPVSAGRR